jgi:hypothetical protein
MIIKIYNLMDHGVRFSYRIMFNILILIIIIFTFNKFYQNLTPTLICRKLASFICVGVFLFNTFYIQSIGSDTVVYSVYFESCDFLLAFTPLIGSSINKKENKNKEIATTVKEKSKTVKQASNKVSEIEKNKIKFKVPEENSGKRFVDKSTNIEYVRTFGLWRCLKCRKKWKSAYTWLSLYFCKNNTDVKNKLVKGMYENTDTVEYNGKNLKKEDILTQFCKSCDNKNNTVINYSNLKNNSKKEPREPHRSNLCAKCLSGNMCRPNDSFI